MNKHNFAAVITEKDRDGALLKNNFCMLLKLSYKFKIKFYNFKMLNVCTVVTTNKIYTK